MKVLLLKKVPRVGVEGDVVTVSPGYALNFLFPQKAGRPATPKDEKDAAERKKKQTMKASDIQAQAQEVKKKLEGAQLLYTGKVSDQGTLYGAVSEKDIVKMLLEQHKVEVEPKHVQLDGHIKAVGTYMINIKLSEKVIAKVPLEIKAQ